MSLSEHISEPFHPIDIVETLAESRDWSFDRVGEDQIAMAVEAQWRTYSITLAWSEGDETLRMIASFEMEPPEERRAALFEMVNEVNDLCWTGAFSFWSAQNLMVYRYGLVCAGGHAPTSEQIAALIAGAVAAAERFYPAFQLLAWGNATPRDALQVAIAEAYGRA